VYHQVQYWVADMYRSENYARIQCSECKKIIDEIMPGKVFTKIKICECQIPVEKVTPIQRKVVKKDV